MSDLLPWVIKNVLLIRNMLSLQSFTAPGAFILTQWPLKDTEVDLWRLCMDHDVNALVVLGDTNEVL